MSVGLAEQETRQLTVDRRHQGNAGVQESLRLVQRTKPRHEPIETEPRCIGDVRRPVARALVVPVVGVASRVVDLRIVVLVPRESLELIGGRSCAVERHDHRGRGRAAPGLSPAVVLGEFPGVGLLRERRHLELHGRSAEEARDLVLERGRGHRGDHPHGWARGRRLLLVQRHPEPVRVQRRGALRSDEGVDVHVTVAVLLSGRGRPVDVAVARRPGDHREELRLAAAAARLHLDLDPRSGGRVGIPRRHQLVECERDGHPLGGP